MKRRCLAALLTLLLFSALTHAAKKNEEKSSEEEHSPKREPIVLIPGFASSRLMAWKFKSCGSGFNINIGDRVWLDVAHVLYDSFRESCWSHCMSLEPFNQTDPEDCKLRVVSSIEAISELDPGQITGPLSSIFRGIIDLLSDNYEYDTTNLAAVPYDWRLPPTVLEERDRYFTNLKNTIETLVEFNRKPAVVIAHSMGNNIFLHFVDWIKLQHPDEWQRWFDSYVSAFFMVGAPLLGSPQTVRIALSGQTFGLPLSESAVRDFMITFGSGPWMFPVPDPRSNTSWPHHPVTIDYFVQKKIVNYTVESVLDGTLWEDTAAYDEQTKGMLEILRKYYQNAEINPLAAPPSRPPINNVYCIYGVNERTELGYQYRVIDDAFRMKKTIWEDAHGELYSTTALLNRKRSLGKSMWNKSGDGTVTYNSLSYCQTWHTGEVNATEIPTVVDTSSRVQGFLELLGIEKLIYGNYRYDSSSVVNGRELKTSVIEIERINHRDIIRSQILLGLLKEELDPRTNTPYMPFSRGEPNPLLAQDLSELPDDTLQEMLDKIQHELHTRPQRIATDKEKEEELQRTVKPLTHEEKEQVKEDAMREAGEEVLDNAVRKGKIPNASTLKSESRVKCTDGDCYSDPPPPEVFSGNNKDGVAQEVPDVRDDDEGSEFRTVSQGGILPDPIAPDTVNHPHHNSNDTLSDEDNPSSEW